MLKLPSDGQSFRVIREKNFLYIDKTEHIYKLVSSEGCFFLSRPRRFGKTLLLSAIEELFLNPSTLFTNLSIGNKLTEFPTHPVIRLSMAGVVNNAEDLEKAIRGKLVVAALNKSLSLKEITDKEGLELNEQKPGLLLEFLITYLKNRENKKVVVLIDEYDAPIQSVITNASKANDVRKVLHDFYSSLKTMSDEGNIRFLFVTGITKFAKASLFSVFNNCTDITMEPEYASICGFTLQEFDEHLAPFLPGALQYNLDNNYLPIGTTPDQFRQKVLNYYDGYSWDGKTKVLNPYSLISFLKSKEFRSYWYASSTPTFLIDLIMKNPYEFIESEDNLMTINMLDTIDVEKLTLLPLLFQTGYLTIDKKFDADNFQVKLPNEEVAFSFHTNILEALSSKNQSAINKVIEKIKDALKNIDSSKLTESFKDILQLYPNELTIPMERYYHAIFHGILTALNFKITSEVSTVDGRIDTVLYYSPSKVFVFEFKFEKITSEMKKTKKGGLKYVPKPIMDKLLDNALNRAKEQLKLRGYAKKFLLEYESVCQVAVGIAGRSDLVLEIY
jgi:hypothetical protein